MAIAGQLFKLAWGGKLFADETWTCSMHITAPDGMILNEEALEAALRTYHIAGTTQFNGAAQFDYFKFNQLEPTTGKYINSTQAHTKFLAAPPLGNGAVCAGQIAVAVSLTTAIQRGRGHIGRWYVPGGTQWAAADATGQMAVGLAQGLGAATKTLIQDVNASTTGNVCVYSKVGQLAQPVTGVKVGRVMDTQRRRRKSLNEDHVVVAGVIA